VSDRFPGIKTPGIAVRFRNGKSLYVKGIGFGCSRDYVTTDDATAIRNMLAEHGSTAKTIVKI